MGWKQIFATIYIKTVTNLARLIISDEVMFGILLLTWFCRKHICSISGYHDRTIFSVNWSPCVHILFYFIIFLFFLELHNFVSIMLYRVSGIIATACGDDCIRLFSENLSNVRSLVTIMMPLILSTEKNTNTPNLFSNHQDTPMLLENTHGFSRITNIPFKFSLGLIDN